MTKNITLAHGNGGKENSELITDVTHKQILGYNTNQN